MLHVIVYAAATTSIDITLSVIKTFDGLLKQRDMLLEGSARGVSLRMNGNGCRVSGLAQHEMA